LIDLVVFSALTEPLVVLGEEVIDIERHGANIR